MGQFICFDRTSRRGVMPRNASNDLHIWLCIFSFILIVSNWISLAQDIPPIVTKNDPTSKQQQRQQPQQQRHPSDDTFPSTHPEQMDEFAKILSDTGDFSQRFPDSPLQLVRPDHHHKRLVIVEENLKHLYMIDQPISTVSVVGKFHSGKSFLMNQIMRKSDGFGIGSKVTPETMGIWIWGRPMKIESADASTQWILLLDTEGFAANNVSENYDAKIFAVSTLMSSKLLYNSVKIIDQSDVDYLELLARRTQLFALKSQMTPQKDWTGDFSPQLLNFPELIWVIQDFVQETDDENCREWLLRLLSSHTRETEGYEISLKDIFPAVDCHTMFIPAAQKRLLANLGYANETDLTPEYRAERDELVRKIKSTIRPKMKNDRPFTGKELAILLRILVNAANAGSLKNIPNRWDAFLETLQKSAVEDCFKFYQAYMANLLVDQAKNEAINCGRLERWHEQSQSKAFNLFYHLLQGLSRSVEQSKPELSELIARSYAAAAELNRQKIHLKLHNVQKGYELQIVDHFLTLELPMLSADLQSIARTLDSTRSAQFIDEIGDLVERANLTAYLDAITKSIQLNLDSTVLRNNQRLDHFFANITDTLIEQAFVEVSIDTANPLAYDALESLLRSMYDRTIASFDRRTERFAAEHVIRENKLNKLKVALQERAAIVREDNERAIGDYVRREMAKFVADFDRFTADIRKNFPMDFSELKAVIVADIERYTQTFVGDFGRYTDYRVYGVLRDEFGAELMKIAEQRQAENFDAYKREVETPLKMAKKTILLSSSMYNTLYSFKRFIISSCMLHLDDGKAKNWSIQLKHEIIESFMREDAELRQEIQSRQGTWSRIVGFFEWLISFFVW